MNEHRFLGLDTHSTADGILRSTEDTKIALNSLETEKNGMLNVDEETHDHEDTSHSGYRVCSMDLDRKWTSLIVKNVKGCKKC